MKERHLQTKIFRRLSGAAFVLGVLLTAKIANAQYDIKVLMPLPLSNTTITNGQQFQTSFRVINTGTTTIPASQQFIVKTYITTGSVTDTIAGLSFTSMISTGSNINPGDSVTEQTVFTYSNFTQSYPNATLCRRVTMVGITDPTMSDNTACTNVNLNYLAPGTGGHNTDTPQYAYFKNTTNLNGCPFNCTGVTRSQTLYKPGEFKDMQTGAIAPSGTITRVFYRARSISNQVIVPTGITLKLGQTTDTNYANTNFFTTTSVLALPSYSVSIPGWIEFVLTTPFAYDKDKSLVVEALGSNGFFSYYDAAPQNRWLCQFTGGTSLVQPGLHEFGFDFGNSTSVDEMIKEEMQTAIYPNPVSSEFHFMNGKAVTGKFEISDVNGKCLLRKDIKDSNDTPISVETLPNGLYFYKIYNQNTGRLLTGKFIVVH